MSKVLCKKDKKTGMEFLEMYLHCSDEEAQSLADMLNSGTVPKRLERNIKLDTNTYHYYIDRQEEMY